MIGTLTLILAGTAMGPFRTADAGSIAEHGEGRTERAGAAAEHAEVERRVAEPLGLRNTPDDLREGAGQVVGTHGAQYVEHPVAVGSLDKLGAVERQLEAGEQALGELEARIEALGTRIDVSAAAEAAARQRVVVVPAGSGRGVVPWFIECTADGLTLYADLEKDQGMFVAFDRIKSSEVFRDFLSAVKAGEHSGHVVTFLIRRGGVKSYDIAQACVASRGVRQGCMPVVGEGKLDLSAFVSKTPTGD